MLLSEKEQAQAKLTQMYGQERLVRVRKEFRELSPACIYLTCSCVCVSTGKAFDGRHQICVGRAEKARRRST